jgi:hypothetical protein
MGSDIPFFLELPCAGTELLGSRQHARQASTIFAGNTATSRFSTGIMTNYDPRRSGVSTPQ